MPDPTALRPDDFEILAVRELRKAGLELLMLKRAKRRLLAERKDDRGDDYALEIEATVRIGGADRRVLIECRREGAPVRAVAVRELRDAVTTRKLEHALLFSAAGYEIEAIKEGKTCGIPLLAVADGRAAFARSAYGTSAAPPSWVPEFMSEVIDLDPTGTPRHHLILSGQPRLILDRLTTPAASPPPEGKST